MSEVGLMDEEATQVKEGPDHYWEALVVGDRLRSAGLTVTEAHLSTWAGLTGDVVRFHIDAEYAADSPFGQRIAHGPFTLSTALGLMTQTGYFNNVLAWLGLDEVRASRPVFIGDTIHAEAAVSTARLTSRPDRGVWTLDYRVLNQRQETVMTFSSSFLVRCAQTHGGTDD